MQLVGGHSCESHKMHPLLPGLPIERRHRPRDHFQAHVHVHLAYRHLNHTCTNALRKLTHPAREFLLGKKSGNGARGGKTYFSIFIGKVPTQIAEVGCLQKVVRVVEDPCSEMGRALCANFRINITRAVEVDAGGTENMCSDHEDKFPPPTRQIYDLNSCIMQLSVSTLR